MNEAKEVSSVGNMDSGFFVSRKELIEWINKQLKLNITKIEQCSNGAVYIQLLDILFPNKSILNKVKWNAKLEYECIINYKLIQSVFNKLGIKKYMDVDKLIKGKYQDNLEFLQWFKAFFERMVDYNNEQIINYDAIERRKISILGERGDYRLLNNFLPDWAKVDIHIIKDKIMNSDNKIVNNCSKRNIDSLGAVGREIPTTAINSGSRGSARKSSSYPNSYASNRSRNSNHSGNNYSTNRSSNSNNYNNNYSTIVNSKKFMTSEKKCIHHSTAHDNYSNSLSYKDTQTHKKHTIKTNTNMNINTNTNNNSNASISTISTHNNINNVNRRLSTSTKLSSQGSLSLNHNRCNTVENQKNMNSLIEQNKKLKAQLESKNKDIMLLQNKLQEEENEKKILLFQKNFYYNKLRFLELLCNQTDDNVLRIDDIQYIIYARENTYFHQTISLKDKTDNRNDLRDQNDQNDQNVQNVQNVQNEHNNENNEDNAHNDHNEVLYSDNSYNGQNFALQNLTTNRDTDLYTDQCNRQNSTDFSMCS
ncbi:EB1 homolog, putative [Plasmodium malariae]|uniref:EB1 homolog, putative n=1 Tax=Plasmodium malariae TaxID=5858 RepID=A0A1A8VZ24_PLAMA|nr:EB1 homolog, putative [Plasmodium malariae]